MPLLYDQTPQGVLDLRSIDPTAAGLSRRRWLQVRELAAAVLWCGACDGCRASVARLIEVANRNKLKPIIASRSAFFRVRAAAVAVGVIVDELEHNERGRTFSERAVNLVRVAELLERTRELARERRQTAARLKTRKMGLTRNLPETYSPYVLNPSKPLKHLVDQSPRATSTSVDRRAHDASGLRGSAHDAPRFNLERASRIALEIVAACGGSPSPRDWAFAVKVALVEQMLGEHWLRDALGGVLHCRPRHPWRYLTACLREKAEARGRRLNRELARVSVPSELARFVPPPPREPRLCAVGEPKA